MNAYVCYSFLTKGRLLRSALDGRLFGIDPSELGDRADFIAVWPEAFRRGPRVARSSEGSTFAASLPWRAALSWARARAGPGHLAARLVSTAEYWLAWL
jgi:hypothetical protein